MVELVQYILLGYFLGLSTTLELVSTPQALGTARSLEECQGLRTTSNRCPWPSVPKFCNTGPLVLLFGTCRKGLVATKQFGRVSARLPSIGLNQLFHLFHLAMHATPFGSAFQ